MRAAELAARLNYEVEWNLVPVSRRRMFIEKVRRLPSAMKASSSLTFPVQMREWAVEQALSVTEVDLVIRYEIFDYGRRHLDTMVRLLVSTARSLTDFFCFPETERGRR